MIAIYWPLDEYDCTEESRLLGQPSTEHHHFEREADAIAAFLWHRANYRCTAPGDGECISSPRCLFHSDRRYHCIRGPRGLLRGIRQSLR